MENEQQTENQKLNLADKGIRYEHNLIDTIGFSFVILLHVLIWNEWSGIMPEGGFNWLVIYFFFLYVMFYALFEHFFGKTPGKFLTKTKVVKKDGSKPTFCNILGRNAARLIPLDSLSYLFSNRGWHDQISDTYVVMDKKKK